MYANSFNGNATSASKVNSNLIIQFNSGNTEGTNKFTFNGSAGKTITIKPGTAISISGTTISHANVVTAGNAGPTANATVNSGGSFTVPYITYNAQGHITGRTNRTITLGKFESSQTRSSYLLGDTGYIYKNGYDAFLHVANEEASSVIKTVHSNCKPKAGTTVTGYCRDKSTNGLYPCCGDINNQGQWTVLFTTGTYGDSSPYYIYRAADGTNRLSNFLVWLTGAWSTSTNG